MPKYRVFPDDSGPYHITTTTVGWAHVFTSIPYFDIITDALSYCRREKGLQLWGYVIMTNHFHAVASTSGTLSLSDVVRDFKRHTSRQIQRELRERGNRALEEFFGRTSLKREGNTEGKVWQDGFHPVHVGDRDRFIQRLEYIENNPVRKGYVELPEYWRYSSARNRVLGDHSVIEIDDVEWE